MNLFDYSNTPGAKARETSFAAAAAVEPVAGRLRRLVLAHIAEHGPSTPDECALALNESVLAIRPRVSELAKQGRLVDTGERRANASTRRAIVWGLA